MFVLRHEHMEAFSRAARESFEDRLAAQMRAEYPQECELLGEAGLRARIRTAVERAQQYGIDVEVDVGEFVRFMFAIDPDFDSARSTAWIRPVLAESWVLAETRLRQIRYTAITKGVFRPGRATPSTPSGPAAPYLVADENKAAR
jgi:hypothetical protein